MDVDEVGPGLRSVFEGTDHATSKICDVCKAMLCNWKKVIQNKRYTSPRRQSLIDMKKAALEEECTLCYQFWMSVQKDCSSDVSGSDSHYGCYFASEAVLRHWGSSAQSMDLRISFCKTGDQETGHTVTAVAYGSAATNKTSFIHERTAPLGLARRWLENCRRTHIECNPVSDHENVRRFLPTRLVSIKGSNVRLCTSDGIPSNSEYATLSHCWGSRRYLILKKDNLKAFHNQVPPAALSKTISDAIEVARYMGFSYIWIDTLCIAQDDPEDWKSESSAMCAVYSGSGLNIAASGASDGSEGCHFARLEQDRCRIDLQHNDLSYRYDVVLYNFIELYLGASPLLRRGWVMQERLLAPRTLHFTKAELFWECHSVNSCETYPDSIPRILQGYASLKKEKLRPSMWTSIVEEYSSCHLTNATDKLVAISGIARHIQQYNHDQYVAGMWRKDLARHLCWRTSRPRSRSAITSYIAPTWSWASSNGPIYQMLPIEPDKTEEATYCITVLDVELENTGHDVFGGLVSGTLHLMCNVLLRVDVKLNPGHHFNNTMVFAGNKKEINTDIYFDDLQGRSGVEIHDLTAMPVISCWHHGSHKIIGILLKRSSEQPGTYERIGLFGFLARERSFDGILAAGLSQSEVNRAAFDDVVAHAASLGQANVNIQLV